MCVLASARDLILRFVAFELMSLPLYALPPANQPPLRYEFGERRESWSREIMGVRHALRVWDAIQRGRTDDLRLWFHPRVAASGRGAPIAIYEAGEPLPNGSLYLSGDPVEDDSLLEDGQFWFTPADDTVRDITRLAYTFLQVVIGSRLARYATPEMIYSVTGGGTPLRVHISPTGVAGVVWLQLARGIEGNIRHERCGRALCRRWVAHSYSTASGGKRKDALYCSTNCRVKAYRERQQEASRLHSTGMPLAKVAAAVRSESKVVRRWIAAVRNTEARRPNGSATKGKIRRQTLKTSPRRSTKA
jgi:hypothetical protein